MSTDPSPVFTMPPVPPSQIKYTHEAGEQIRDVRKQKGQRGGLLLFSSENIMCINDPYSKNTKVKPTYVSNKSTPLHREFHIINQKEDWFIPQWHQKQSHLQHHFLISSGI